MVYSQDTNTAQEVKSMADNNYTVEEVGGIQKLICPVCKKEITNNQSKQYRMSDSARIHYPNCDDPQ
jgi:uncharacterized CHY-type Zn-finger protein